MQIDTTGKQSPPQSRLFDFLVVVCLKQKSETDETVIPFVKHVFPDGLELSKMSFMKSIADFCFPDVESVLDPKQQVRW